MADWVFVSGFLPRPNYPIQFCPLPIRGHCRGPSSSLRALDGWTDGGFGRDMPRQATIDKHQDCCSRKDFVLFHILTRTTSGWSVNGWNPSWEDDQQPSERDRHESHPFRAPSGEYQFLESSLLPMEEERVRFLHFSFIFNATVHHFWEAEGGRSDLPEILNSNFSDIEEPRREFHGEELKYQ